MGASIYQYTVIPSRLFDFLYPEINETSLKAIASNMYQDLGLSTEEIENYLAAIVSFPPRNNGLSIVALTLLDTRILSVFYMIRLLKVILLLPLVSNLYLPGTFINAGFTYDDNGQCATIDSGA